MRATYILLAAMLPMTAFATKNNEPKAQPSTQTQSQAQAQEQNALGLGLGVGLGIGEGGDADASAVGIGEGGDANAAALGVGLGGEGGAADANAASLGVGLGGEGGAADANAASVSGSKSGSNSGGNAFSTSYNSAFNSRAYALAVASATAAPAVQGECLIHLRGYNPLPSIGASGRTKYDKDCVRFVRCVALADRFAALGQVALAVRQVQACGGVAGEPVVAVEEHEHPQYATSTQLQRAFEAAQQK